MPTGNEKTGERILVQDRMNVTRYPIYMSISKTIYEITSS